MTSTIRVTSVGPAPTGTTTNLMSGLTKTYALAPDTQASVTSSLNISSIADTATAHGTFSLTNNMSDANYVVLLGNETTIYTNNTYAPRVKYNATKTTSAVGTMSGFDSTTNHLYNTQEGYDKHNMAIVGDLA
jgi:hypothetical protein